MAKKIIQATIQSNTHSLVQLLKEAATALEKWDRAFALQCDLKAFT